MRKMIWFGVVALLASPVLGDPASDAQQARVTSILQAVQNYSQSYNSADKQYADTLDRMIKDATKAGKTDQAAQLRQERDQTLALPSPLEPTATSPSTPAVIPAAAAKAAPSAAASPIVVQSARYGRAPTWIDATQKIASGIHGDQLRIAVNLANFLGQDPIPGNKFLEMNCLIAGSPVQMRFYDSSFENPTITVGPPPAGN